MCGYTPEAVGEFADSGDSEAAAILQQVLVCLGATDEQQQQIRAEFERGLESAIAEFLKRRAVEKSIPLIRSRAERFFSGKRVRGALPEDLASAAVVKIWASLSRRAPSGNVGAWVMTICRHVLYDESEKMQREKCLEKRVDVNVLESREQANCEDLERRVDALPKRLHAIAILRLQGLSWTDIREALHISENERIELAQRLGVPGD